MRALVALTAAAVALGCAGPDLRKERIASISPLLLTRTSCPGSTGHLEVRVNLENGKQLATRGPAKGEVAWTNFSLSSDVVTVGREGQVLMPEDPRAYLRAEPSIRIQTAGHPELNALVPVPVRYDCEFVADFSGRDGTDGSAGRDGQDATAEQEATAGEHGSDGQQGTSAEDVKLTLALVNAADGTPYLQALAQGQATGARHLFLIDTRGGTLAVLARGGNAGSGGDGGRAGSGKAAGGGGSGGDAGDGGNIEVVLDEAAAPYAGLVHYETSAGRGGVAGKNSVGSSLIDIIAAVVLQPRAGTDGRAGKVTPRKESVPPLW